MELKQSAILIFSRSKSQEASNKVFYSGKGKKTNEKIADALIQNTIQVARNSGLPVFIKFTHQQFGNTFGERLGNAMDEVFQRGFNNVIAIGNDCPSLNSETLSKVNTILQEKKLVIGPAIDGGLYLIGINRKYFDKKSFAQFSWRHHTLIDDWITFASNNCISYTTLPQLEDIDDHQALSRFLNSHELFSSLRKKLEFILATIIQKTNSRVTCINTYFFQNNNALRGPPSFFS